MLLYPWEKSPHWIQGWISPRIGLDNVEEKKTSCIETQTPSSWSSSQQSFIIFIMLSQLTYNLSSHDFSATLE
jgi:hypothetical protein